MPDQEVEGAMGRRCTRSIRAVVVRDGKVYVLYRAEDDTGDMMIGGHTSRLGLWSPPTESTSSAVQRLVFYPDKDDQKDKRMARRLRGSPITENEDGTYV